MIKTHDNPYDIVTQQTPVCEYDETLLDELCEAYEEQIMQTHTYGSRSDCETDNNRTIAISDLSERIGSLMLVPATETQTPISYALLDDQERGILREARNLVAQKARQARLEAAGVATTIPAQRAS